MTRHYLVGDVAYPEANLVAVECGKPVVVIDPDDREAVERLRRSLSTHFGDVAGIQHALRELANPKPEVFRHFIGHHHDGGLKTAMCGKVWRPDAQANVAVVGDCPECVEIVKAGWSA